MDPLTKVAPEHVFHFQDGKKAHNLQDLRDALASMDDEVFRHHVDETNNDFANWVEFVYGNVSLAQDLRQVKSAQHMVDILDVELGHFGGEPVADEPVTDASVADKAEQQASKGSSLDAPEPPHELDTSSSASSSSASASSDTSSKAPSLQAAAPHLFVVKEFMWGLLAGFLMGFLLFASLAYWGVLFV